MPLRSGPWTLHETCISDAKGYPLLEAVCGRAGSPEISVDPDEARAILAAPEMYALLKEIEWAGNKVDSNLVDHCPCCGCVRPDGHATFCRLAAVLKAVEGEENA